MADDLSGALDQIGQQYPALAPHLKNSAVSYGKSSGPKDDRQLEFYQPWDSENPTPGKNHIQLFNRDLKGADLNNAIAGDLLHHLGSIDPSTGRAVDPTWYMLKQQLGTSRSDGHLANDRRVYETEAANPSYQTAPYPQWEQQSRLDAYVRGGLFPQQNPGWSDYLSPQMQPVFDQMNQYLRTAPTK